MDWRDHCIFSPRKAIVNPEIKKVLAIPPATNRLLMMGLGIAACRLSSLKDILQDSIN